MRRGLYACFVFVFFCTTANAQVRFVTPNGGGNASGTSWGNAINGTVFRTALRAAAHGTQFWLAAGSYKPDASVRDSDFYVPSGVKIYGGFAGNETLLSQRDSTNTINRTILTGELQDDNYIYNNSYNVMWMIDADSTTELNSITITQGCSTGDIEYDTTINQHSGAGIEIINSYARIANVVFDSNITPGGGGGGMCYANGGVRLYNCTFTDNEAAGGAGVYFSKDQDYPGYNPVAPMPALFDHCVFTGNGALDGGGGVYASNAIVTFTNCVFDKDSIVASMYGGYGAGIMGDNNDTLIIHNCTFKNIHSFEAYNYGGAIYTDGTCLVENSLFENNSAYVGAAILITGPAGFITNSTFINNKNNGGNLDGTVIAKDNGGIVNISNCIFDSVIGDGLAQFAVYASSTMTFYNSLLMLTLPSTVINGGGNLQNADPLFVSYNNGDYHLKPCSPAINSGQDSLMLYDAYTYDLDSNHRRYAGSVVDMGAYEFQAPDAAPVAAFTDSMYANQQTVTVTYTGAFANTLDSLVWTWGDGQQQTVTSSLTNSLSHTYNNNGNHYICVTAYSTCGSNQTCHQTLAVDPVNVLNGITVYPNPAGSNLTLEGAEGTDAIITNAIGQQVMAFPVNSKIQVINVAKLEPGIYMITLKSKNGIIATMRIVKG